MPKLTLEFNLPAESQMADMSQKGPNYHMCLTKTVSSLNEVIIDKKCDVIRAKLGEEASKLYTDEQIVAIVTAAGLVLNEHVGSSGLS